MDPRGDRVDRVAQLAELIAELAAALAEDPAATAPAVEPPVLLDLAEAARLLGISRAKLYDGPIKRGELVTVLIDSRRLVPRAAVDGYVAAAAKGPRADPGCGGQKGPRAGAGA